MEQEAAASTERMDFNSLLLGDSIDHASAAAVNAALSAVETTISSSDEISAALLANAAADFCPGEVARATHSQLCG